MWLKKLNIFLPYPKFPITFFNKNLSTLQINIDIMDESNIVYRNAIEVLFSYAFLSSYIHFLPYVQPIVM